MSKLVITESRAWWYAKKGECYARTIPYVRTVENYQAELFNKFLQLEAVYDTNPRTNRFTMGANGTNAGTRMGRSKAIVTENLIASAIDTVAANVSDQDISVRIQTDNADWSHQRQAKALERYLDGLAKLLDIGGACRRAFKVGAALKGSGFVKVWADRFDQLRVQTVPVDNIIVDEIECREGAPKQLHYRDFFDREELIAQYPKYEDQITKAQAVGSWRLWAGYRPMQPNEVVVIESWRLPIGPRDHKNYVPGRHTITIDGCDLLDEEYHKAHYPFAKMVWNGPSWGYYGISLAERILPHQNLLNRRNYQINRSLDLKADPVTYVHQADQHLAVKTVNQIGSIAVYRGAIPQTVDHQAVGAETYQSRQQIKIDAQHEAGIDEGMSTGGVPAGIESGVGVREVRTTRTQRFAIQEQGFERLWLDCLLLVLDCCKDLRDAAPKILHVSKYGSKEITWADVDMDDARIQLSAASTLADSPAGRQQRVVELAQAGVITLDEARDLMDHPDIERVISMYNAAIEDAEYTIEEILDGAKGVMPEPYQNLNALMTMAQRTYLRVRDNGAPESVLEALADLISVSANILNPPPPPMPAPGPSALPPGVPGAPSPQLALPPGAPPGLAAQASAGAPTFAPGTYAPMNA